MAKKHLTEKQAAALYREIKAKGAEFTKQQAVEMAAAWNSNGEEMAQRMALAILSCDCAPIFDAIEKEDDAAQANAWAHAVLGRYLDRLKSATEIVTAAHLRLGVALAVRPDMHALIAHAQGIIDERGQGEGEVPA